jgi:putative CocE/NonD family hydrolase
MRPTVLALAGLFVATALAGCISTSQPLADDLAGRAFDTSRGWSMPLAPGVYGMLEPVLEMVPSFDGTPIAMGLFLPDIAGCDFAAQALPAECRIPVVMDAGPYYGDHADVDKFRPPLVEWLVPRGYAVVQMAIRGTGQSGGCMELFSMNEQQDVDAMVTWLAERSWSNGNVGMMGRSYDGTTPLMAAALGNPHLKTIVPISAVPDLRDLMFKNGTSEFRGPIFHNLVYWATYGVGVSPFGVQQHRWDHASEQVCDDVLIGTIDPTSATLTGNAQSDYFEERVFRERIIANYQGSVWIVHGLEDWNVNPSQVVPWIRDLQQAGIPTKAWLGVWGHAYPDRSDEHRNVRWDWAEQTVQWFDFYLKGQGAQPSLDVEVEDSLFVWRKEATYPPADATLVPFELGADMALAPEGSAEQGQVVLGGGAATAFTVGGLGSAGPVGDRFTFTSEPLEQDLRVAGLPQAHIQVVPTTAAGGYVFAELYDVFPDNRQVRIGWGAIHVRHHAGGNGEPANLAPGQPVTLMMELEPTDAHLGQGHRVRLVLHRDGVEDILPSPTNDPLVVALGGGASVLRLPSVERADVLPAYSAPGLTA